MTSNESNSSIYATVCEAEEGCVRTDLKAHNLCGMHYMRLRRQGHTFPARPLPSGPDHPLWEGGLYTNPHNGYVYFRTRGKAVLHHRKLMEEMIGRPLIKGETVHHKNGVRDDNRPENLELWSNACPQPVGQRVIDLVAWAKEILALYGDLAAKEK
jgi:hypothetical protein